MPHSTSDMATNGDKQSSTISHLTSYPVVSDGVETFKSNPYGKKSLEIAGDAYERFGKPVEPYVQQPYEYVKPYVAKADEIGDSLLGKADSHFPIMKEDTSKIIDYGKSWVFWPFQLAGEGRDYLISTWSDEYDKTARHKDRGQGYSTLVLALISTELKIASDFFQTVADYLGPKYEESKDKATHYVQAAGETADKYKKFGQQKADEYSKVASQKVDEYTKTAQDKASEYQKVGEKKGEEVKQQAQQGKEEVKKQAGQK